MAKNTIQKNLRVSKALVQILEREADQYGYTFGEYVQYLLVRRAEDILSREETINDPQLVKDILEARRDSKAGKLKTLKTPQDIDDYINSILEEEDEQV